MIYIIDRFEGEMAVCEDMERKKAGFPRSALYEGAKAGDWFEKKGNVFTFLPEDTEIARQKNIELQQTLFGE